MTNTVEGLVDNYDAGRLSRRELIQGLAALAAGGCAVRAASPSSVMRGTSLNHVSLAVSDVETSRKFYRDLLGLEVVSRQENGINLGLGSSFLVPGPPRQHHLCIGVEDFELEAVAARLRENGLQPSFNRGVEVYFRDPDDILVQLSAEDHRG